jgi:predicted dehydrogenase
MMRIGVLGMGMMGWFHASTYRKLPNAQLVAIADCSPHRLEAQEVVIGNIAGDEKPIDFSAVARYTDASQLITEANVDVVDICLPTFLHARYAVEALKAGCHVLCEKPMALTLAEADQMMETARRADRLLMIAQCLRFWPEYQFLHRCVRDGTFGQLLSLNMYRVGGRPTWSWNDWFLDSSLSGGTIRDLHIHDVDFANYLLGLPSQIHATARKSEATGYYDIIHACYNYHVGPQVHLHAGWSVAQFPFSAGYEAWFERTFIRFSHTTELTLEVFDNPMMDQGRPAEYEKGDPNYNVVAYFLNSVEKDEPPAECLPESTRDSLELVDKEIAAVESGQTVSGRN